MIIARRTRDLERLLAVAAVCAGLGAWVFYFQRDLVLSHYDAKAHLVVARRVFDSITPGWRQIGAVWLPLPHLLHLIPTQIDVLYRTGAFGSLLSIACLGASVWASARLIIAATGSSLGAVTAAVLLASNPNLLYIHVTPMTEPLLITAILLVALWTYEWVAAGAGPSERPPASLGLALFAAAWTRYEAWAVIGAAFVFATHAMWRSGMPIVAVVRRAGWLGVWPSAAALSFLLISRLTVGSWFVSDGFYVLDPTYYGRAWRALVAVWWGTHRLGGYAIEIVALVTAGVVTIRALVSRGNAPLLVLVALLTMAVLPFGAFLQGHPFRMRYMIPLAAVSALFSGLAVGLLAQRLGKAHVALAAVLVASALIESPPWKKDPPLLEEAQWDVPASQQRRAVTRCLGEYHGEKVLASMGSLAHYMQELSHKGFRIADFVHEGNGSIWDLAFETGPARHVGWMLVEEEAENGDVLAQRIRRDPAFAMGMIRVCEGGGVSLYRRQPRPPRTDSPP